MKKIYLITITFLQFFVGIGGAIIFYNSFSSNKDFFTMFIWGSLGVLGFLNGIINLKKLIKKVSQ